MAWFVKVERLYWEQWFIQLNVIPPAPSQTKSYYDSSQSVDTGGESPFDYHDHPWFLLDCYWRSFSIACWGSELQWGRLFWLFSFANLVCPYDLHICSCLYDWWCFGNTCGVITVCRTNDGWKAKASCSFRDGLARGYKSNFATCQREKGSHSTSFASRCCRLIPFRNRNPKVHNHNIQVHICKNLYKPQYVLVNSRAESYYIFFMHSLCFQSQISFCITHHKLMSECYVVHSASDSSFSMDMFKRMLQTGPPTMLSWTVCKFLLVYIGFSMDILCLFVPKQHFYCS